MLNECEPDFASASVIAHRLSPLVWNARGAFPVSKSSATADFALAFGESPAPTFCPAGMSLCQPAVTAALVPPDALAAAAAVTLLGVASGASAASASTRPPVATSPFHALAEPS